ncbi:MAG: FGGY-family carbohydrate kinase [Actinomycetia bacterium]|nr:FGGY-family carbohydrate kinase [Actinomycetes bacterium]
MENALVVGVDVGSSGARAVAIDRTGVVKAISSVPYEGSYDPAGGEADPTIWLTGLVASVAALGCDAPVALGVGGHSPTTVASTGDLALTFRHSSGDSSSPQDQHVAHAAVLQDRLGSHVEPRLLWDYLLSQLGGDPSIQSVWPEMDPLAGFGDPVPVGASSGTSTGAHGVPAGVVLVPGSNDAYMTTWASGIDTPGRAFDPGGRAGGLGIAAVAGDHEDLARYGMPSHVPGISIVGGPVASHGALLDWWSTMTGRSVGELVELAGAVEPGARGVMALPYLEGARSPRWNRELRAEIVGLENTSDVGVVARALLESTAYGLAHIAKALASEDVGLERVVCSGGPSRSLVWTSIKAAVLEVPVDVPDCSEMAAYGAALAAGAAVDWWPRPGSGVPGDWPMPAMTTVEPEPLDVYRRGLDRFISLGDQAALRAAEINVNI